MNGFEMKYTHQAQATRAFGVEFRSKLEAQYAYWFQEMGLEWSYSDSPWHDFIVNGIHVEIKPFCHGALDSAADRMPHEEKMLILLGSPPDIKTKSPPFVDWACFTVWKTLPVTDWEKAREKMSVKFRCAYGAICRDPDNGYWFEKGFVQDHHQYEIRHLNFVGADGRESNWKHLKLKHMSCSIKYNYDNFFNVINKEFVQSKIENMVDEISGIHASIEFLKGIA